MNLPEERKNKQTIILLNVSIGNNFLTRCTDTLKLQITATRQLVVLPGKRVLIRQGGEAGVFFYNFKEAGRLYEAAAF